MARMPSPSTAAHRSTTEKSYLIGKFARVALGTRHIDYNGRLCMVSAGMAYKLAFDVDRSPIPWSDIPKARGALCDRREYRRMRPDHYRLHLALPRQGRQTDRRRSAYDAHFAERRSLSAAASRHGPGAAQWACCMSFCRDDLQDRPDSSRNHTTGFEAVKASVGRCDPRSGPAEMTGVPPEAIEKAAHCLAKQTGPLLMHARGIGAPVQRRGELFGAASTWRWPPAHLGREGCGCTMITGQGNGQGGREHGQKCDQLPGQRSLLDPRRASTWPASGASRPRTSAARLPAQEIMNAIHAGEIKALLSICFNPLVSPPNADFTREALEKLEFFGVIGFLPFRNRALCRRRAGREFARGRRRRHLQHGGPGDPYSTRRSTRRAMPVSTRRSSAIWPAVWTRGKFFPFQTPREIFEELREASRGGHADYYGITYEKIDAQMGVFWPCPTVDHPGTPRLLQDGISFYPGRQMPLPGDRVARERRSC